MVPRYGQYGQYDSGFKLQMRGKITPILLQY